MNPTVSYLITTHNENIEPLLDSIMINLSSNDEIIILDDYSNDEYVYYYAYHNPLICIHQHHLNNNYSEHKNYGISRCTKDYIFAIDADELPPESLLGDNLKNILEENPTTEAFAVSRINYVTGCQKQHAQMYGWALENIHGESVINWTNNYDYQWRIFKRLPHIRYERRLHEKIEGYKSYAYLPPQEEHALTHRKTIEKQLATNARYNQDFTVEENKGHV
jgi:glycosyltransferase involved in cell wall biosynthesis